MQHVIAVGAILLLGGQVQLLAEDAGAELADSSGPVDWTAVVVDGESKAELEGVTVEVNGLKAGAAEPQPMLLTSNSAGRLTISLPRGKATSAQVRTPGWWMHGWKSIGDLSGYKGDDGRPIFTTDDGRPIVGDPEKTVTITLWKGTVVGGRLLRPDGSPAAGVVLNAGVYIHSDTWKERLGMDRTWQSWDHGQWPNWNSATTTDEDGKFSVTVPPPDARSWIRLGTTGLGFSAIDPPGKRADGKVSAIAEFAPFEFEVPHSKHRKFNLALKLKKGARLRGRVLDAEGKPLGGVRLRTSSEHGPYAGRSVESAPDGTFEFLPMDRGTFTLSPDARLRDGKGEVNSRDVQAVLLSQNVTVGDADEPIELTVQAVPHVTLEFEWIDRRAKKGAVAYYGCFAVHGKVARAGQEPVWWRGETERTTKEGRQILFVKVPREIIEPTLQLSADSVVTASYEDEERKAGPGAIPLGDITDGRGRIIYGDEPRER